MEESLKTRVKNIDMLKLDCWLPPIKISGYAPDCHCYSAHLQASTSLSTRSFCESILFVHLKPLRGGELHLVRTVGMVKLDDILFEILSKK